jgi:hypothetical protein
MMKVIVWTDELIEKFHDLWVANLSLTRIATEFGVSRNAVAGKAYRLGLTQRKPWESKPGAKPRKRYVPGAPRKTYSPGNVGEVSVKKPLLEPNSPSTRRANYAGGKADIKRMFENAWANTSRMQCDE